MRVQKDSPKIKGNLQKENQPLPYLRESGRTERSDENIRKEGDPESFGIPFQKIPLVPLPSCAVEISLSEGDFQTAQRGWGSTLNGTISGSRRLLFNQVKRLPEIKANLQKENQPLPHLRESGRTERSDENIRKLGDPESLGIPHSPPTHSLAKLRRGDFIKGIRFSNCRKGGKVP
ncbi:hypothetical protein CDAR_193441 [Caerostris darwini]|uniref:Uncharacterized protein n=1 Tax=Caerostris darwini TaxID=1538125 RepID=A0AAV4RT81_9ARAC|nr:hypothetical protein CDAR_193441 [Caerostris darwini]